MKQLLSAFAIGISLLYTTTAHALTPSITETEKVFAGDGAPMDRYGDAVVVDGDTAMVGAWGNDELATDAGAVYVYTRDAAGVWSMQQKLSASDASADGRFGSIIAIQGDTAIIGRDSWDFDLSLIGSVYVFTRDANGVWSESQKITAFDEAPGDMFGQSLDFDGSTLMIGATGDDDGGSSTGSVYVYTQDAADNWVFQQKLLATTALDLDQLGGAIAVSGDKAAITATGYDTSPEITNTGIVYLFSRDAAGSWTQVQSILPPHADVSNNVFGQALAMQGDALLIGSDFDDQNGVNAGAVFLYQADALGVWTLQQELLASDGMDGDYFGQSVDIDGSNLIIGAYGDDDNAEQAGSVYVFTMDGSGVWSERLKLLASDAADYDYMAMGTTGIGINADTVLVGVPLSNTSLGSSTGAGYFYDVAISSGPDIALSTASVSFGELLLGQSVQRLLTVSNIGSEALTISGISLAGGVDFSQINDCPASLLPAQACLVTVTFAPTSEGALSDTLTVYSNDPTEPAANVTLTGTGITQLADLLVSAITAPDPLPAGGYATISITVANQGGADVNGGYYVHLYLDNTELGMDWISSAPAAGATTEVSWFVSLPNFGGNHTLTATVDTLNDIEESNEGNNSTSISVFLQR